MKRWYKFWKKSGPNCSYDDGYQLIECYNYDRGDYEKIVRSEVEMWAETVGGGFNTHYSYGWERVEVPSEKWLKNEIKYTKSNITHLTEDLKELVDLKRKHYGNKRYSIKKTKK